MAAAIRRFRSRSDLLRQDHAARVRAGLAGAGDGLELSPSQRRVFDAAISAAVAVVDRHTAVHNERSFIMLYPSQNRLVIEHLRNHSKRPKVAPVVWAWLIELARMEDGEVLITREGLIERVGASAYSVDAVLRELVAFGALIRLREPEPGKQGRGTVRYFLNPRVGTHLPAGERSAAQSAAPRLRVVPVDPPGSVRRHHDDIAPEVL